MKRTHKHLGQRKTVADIFHNEVTAFIVLVISLIITALGWRISEIYVERRAYDRFQFEVEDAQARIIKRMAEYEQVLRGGIALFRTIGGSPEREQWHEYVTTLNIDKYYPGIQGMGYSLMLQPEALAAHTAAVRSEGFSDYSVHPAGRRAQYSAIVFLEPFDWRNQRAFGYDMFSNPARRDAMERARDSGQPAVSGRVTLVQETDQDIQAGFLMYLPYYREGMPTETTAQRREALVGYVYSPFRAKDLMKGILGHDNPPLDFQLYDGSKEQTADTLLYDTREGGPKNGTSRYTALATITLPGREWSVAFASRPVFDANMASSQPEIIFFGGLVVDLLLFLVIWSLAGERKRVQRKAESITERLREETGRLQLAQEAARSGIWDFNIATNALHWDDRMFALYGLDREQFTGDLEAWRSCVLPEDLSETEEVLARSLQRDEDFAAQFRISRPSGEILHIEAKGVVQRDGEGKPLRIIGINRDITEKVVDEEKLKLAASVFHHTHEGIVITDRDARILDINPTFSTITGYTRDEVLGSTPSILSSGRHAGGFYEQMWEELLRKGYWRGELWNRRKNGESYAELLNISAVRDEEGEISHFVGVFSDVTRLKEQQVSLERMAKYDPLTQLPNRVLLADRMQQAMAQTQRSGKLLAVCYLDLDRFKPVNDRMGHHSGDELLVSVARRLHEQLRSSDSAARLGGDEFVLLLTQLNTLDEVHEALDRVLKTLCQPYQLAAGEVMDISASIGVTLYPTDEADSDTLMRHADQAMYIAKQQGRSRYHLFDPEYDRLSQATMEEVQQIEHALPEGQFVLHYQPKVDMRRGQVIGMEALIRWQHPQRGLLPPAEFLPLIENSPFSIQIGEWVITQAIRELAQWHKQGLSFSVSVNVSGLQLQQPQFNERLALLLRDYPLKLRARLELEVLETTALDDLYRVSDVIAACRQLGVTFSLDDFGTGYSSLTYLKRLPVDTLKIDQSFVRDMLDDPEDFAIIEGIIGLAHAFRRQVIAEGVESLEHGSLLLRLGCDLAQGYGIARPMPAEQVAAWIDAYEQPAEWRQSGEVDWSRRDLPLLSAEIEHRRWVDDLIASITSGADNLQPPQLDYGSCNFGRWYYGKGRTKYGHLVAYKAIETSHRRLHKLARKLVDLSCSGQRSEALDQLPQLREIGNQVQQQILQLKAAVVNETDSESDEGNSSGSLG